MRTRLHVGNRARVPANRCKTWRRSEPLPSTSVLLTGRRTGTARLARLNRTSARVMLAIPIPRSKNHTAVTAVATGSRTRKCTGTSGHHTEYATFLGTSATKLEQAVLPRLGADAPHGYSAQLRRSGELKKRTQRSTLLTAFSPTFLLLRPRPQRNDRQAPNSPPCRERKPQNTKTTNRSLEDGDLTSREGQRGSDF